MNIITRVGTPLDLPQAARFWSEHSGWGEMDEDTWMQNFGSTPQGPAALILAEVEENAEMIGQFIFLPVPVSIHGRDVLAYRPFAPIVKSDLRMRDDAISLQGVLLQMYLFAVEHLRQKGAELLYLLPDPRWARIFSFAPFFQTATFPLWSIALNQAQALPGPANLRIGPMDFSDSRIDSLWQQNRKQHICLALRDQVFLQWKNSHRSYELWAVSDQSGNLWGGVVSLRKIQQKQCLICDVLCSEQKGAFAAVLQAAVHFLAQNEVAYLGKEQAMEKIAILATTKLLPVLQKLGLEKDNYQFHLVVHALNPALSPEQIAPEHWYLSAND